MHAAERSAPSRSVTRLWHRSRSAAQTVETIDIAQQYDKSLCAVRERRFTFGGVCQPGIADGAFIASLMKQVNEPGQFASWIAPPRIGIGNKPGDFEYVKIAA